ncbi:ABC transporter permease [Methanocaldococcus indicus]|uniref:ABC transporter permease n=1 Tax=Methanocaldococcus indicus TaxID=213231 RepID=UPI003C6CD86F
MIKLIIAFVFVLISIIISYIVELNLEKKIFIVCILALIQLILLGYVLFYIFSFGVLGIIIVVSFMIFMASYLVTKEIDKIGKTKLFLSLLLTFIVTTSITMFILIFGVIELKPEYVIPLAGMVVGNTMNTTQLTLENIIEMIKNDKNTLLGYFALGATELIALKPYIKKAVKLAIIPQMNRTKSVGIIFIPGAMVGMILAGANPIKAAEIQIVIMWMILSSSIISGVLICYLLNKELVRI